MKEVVILAVLLLVTPAFADLNANATLSPRYVDTSVVNQTFTYTISLFNESNINRTIITIPSGYNVTGIVNVTTAGQSCTVLATCTTALETENMTINFSSSVNISTSPIVVTFTANTSSSAVVGSFTSYLNNSAYHNQTTTGGSSNVTATTTQIINVTAVTAEKLGAIVNGTDYWQFKLTLGFLANVPGLIQLRLSNWTYLGNTIALTDGTSYYASFRNQSAVSGSSMFNVTNGYGSSGINKTDVTDFYLKMIIPAGTPSLNSWSASYNFLFRSYP